MFVSVLLVRGRVEPLKWYSLFQWGWREPVAWFREWWNPLQPTAMVDLAKPAFKLGLAAIEVGVDAFKLKVEVTPEKQVYPCLLYTSSLKAKPGLSAVNCPAPVAVQSWR